jgi:CBS domain-containing protein
MRAPLTAVVFALELTHDINVLLPLLLAVSISYAFTVLVLKRSILTEKISRRGYHLSCEYAVDPLEIIFASEVVRTAVVALPADATPEAVSAVLGDSSPNERHQQRLFPVVDDKRRVIGVITRFGLRQWLAGAAGASRRTLGDAIERHPVVAHPDEPLRAVVFRMAETGLTRLPVISRSDGTLVGMIALTDLLAARSKILEAERRRERVLGARLRLFDLFGRGRAA